VDGIGAATRRKAAGAPGDDRRLSRSGRIGLMDTTTVLVERAASATSPPDDDTWRLFALDATAR
jgi:hypothetical protein